MTDLMLCPFCGKVPRIVCEDNSYGAALVTCGDDNDCPVDLTAWADLNEGETLSNAIAAWNTRASSRENIALREAGRKALNFIENTEGELGIKLDSGDALRAALKLSNG
jgi:hypothetical protein